MDPRTQEVGKRVANLSPLMRALTGRRSASDVVNFCPFGCQMENLDENGHCHHLIGFYDGGSTYEPRKVRKVAKDGPKGRPVTLGAARKPMENGFKLVRITTSARVYSERGDPDLVPGRNEHLKSMGDLAEKERAVREFAERIKNPVLEGEWDSSVYESIGRLTAAAPAPTPK